MTALLKLTPMRFANSSVGDCDSTFAFRELRTTFKEPATFDVVVMPPFAPRPRCQLPPFMSSAAEDVKVTGIRGDIDASGARSVGAAAELGATEYGFVISTGFVIIGGSM